MTKTPFIITILIWIAANVYALIRGTELETQVTLVANIALALFFTYAITRTPKVEKPKTEKVEKPKKNKEPVEPLFVVGR